MSFKTHVCTPYSFQLSLPPESVNNNFLAPSICSPNVLKLSKRSPLQFSFHPHVLSRRFKGLIAFLMSVWTMRSGRPSYLGAQAKCLMGLLGWSKVSLTVYHYCKSAHRREGRHGNSKECNLPQVGDKTAG